MDLQKAEYWVRLLLSARLTDESGGLAAEAVGYVLRRLSAFEAREELLEKLLECFDLDNEHPQLAEDCGDGYRAGRAAKAVRDFGRDKP